MRPIGTSYHHTPCWRKLSPPICHIQYKQNYRISEKLLHAHFSVNMICKFHLTYCSNFLITHSINAFATTLDLWTSDLKCIQDLRLHLNTGFELMDTFAYLDSTFGKLLFVEFFETFTGLVFSTYFASSTIYRVLRRIETKNRYVIAGS